MKFIADVVKFIIFVLILLLAVYGAYILYETYFKQHLPPPTANSAAASESPSISITPYSAICSNLFQAVFASLDCEFPFDAEQLAEITTQCENDIREDKINAASARKTLVFLDLIYPVIQKREFYSRMLRNVTEVTPSAFGNTPDEEKHQRERRKFHNINGAHRQWLEYINGEGIYLGYSPRPKLLRQLDEIFMSEREANNSPDSVQSR